MGRFCNRHSMLPSGVYPEKEGGQSTGPKSKRSGARGESEETRAKDCGEKLSPTEWREFG